MERRGKHKRLIMHGRMEHAACVNEAAEFRRALLYGGRTGPLSTSSTASSVRHHCLCCKASQRCSTDSITAAVLVRSVVVVVVVETMHHIPCPDRIVEDIGGAFAST